MNKVSIKIALAYVGVIVGAGLSSGQDILQYFLSFGKIGMIGIVLLGIMNILFGRIIVTLGCYYQSDNHQDVLTQISSPLINKVIDFTLILSNFIIGFVMIAGAGANLKQQVGLPAWVGALVCSILIILISYLDFDKITGVLGIFTPVLILMIFGIAVLTFWGKSYDFNQLDATAKSIKSSMPNIGFSVINYYALCAMTGVSMAFVLGGSVVRIGVAEKGGTIGGVIIGIIIGTVAATLFAKIDIIKDAEIPMLVLANNISPIFAYFYTFTIFALIFNTAFSLDYALAKRLAGNSKKRTKVFLIGIVIASYALSFLGFRELISIMYPILGYIGIILLIVLVVAWLKEKENIREEKFIRRRMIKLYKRKTDENLEYTQNHKKEFNKLGEKSSVDTKEIKETVKEFVDKNSKTDN
ncbi:YkvI family membrane protein [Terrisporobacter sp.]